MKEPKMPATVTKLQVPTAERQIEMAVSEWIAIPDNPIQRDTEARLRKATKPGGHLLIQKPTHRHVAMCEDPKGNRWKGDGHTRSLGWQRGVIPSFATLAVDVYPVRDARAAEEIYKLFDSKAAVETASEQVTGAYRKSGFIPSSKLFSKNVLSNALRVTDSYARGMKGEGGNNQRIGMADIYTLIASWLPEIKKIDEMHLESRRFPGPILTAALLTFRKHGNGAREFWRLYSDDQGQKLDGMRDPVQALCEFMLENRVVGGRTEMTGKALSAFDAHLEHRTMTRNLVALDPSRYMIRAKRS